MTASLDFPDFTDDEISAAADASEAGLDFYAAEYPLNDFRRDFRHLRDMIGGHVRKIWASGLPDDERAELVAQTVSGGQQLVSHIAQSYAAKHFGAVFDPFRPGPDITDRPNVSKADQYLRVVDEPDEGKQLRRLETMANTDMQLAKTRTLYSALNGDGAPVKMYRRVPGGDNTCELCEIASDQVYFTDDLMPIHDNCGCDVEEETGEGLTEHDIAYHHLSAIENDDTTDDPKIVDLDAAPDEDKQLAIREHGELGPVLTWAHQDFTGPADLPNPIAPRELPGGDDGE
jgi:hypothetical protein